MGKNNRTKQNICSHARGCTRIKTERWKWKKKIKISNKICQNIFQYFQVHKGFVCFLLMKSSAIVLCWPLLTAIASKLCSCRSLTSWERKQLLLIADPLYATILFSVVSYECALQRSASLSQNVDSLLCCCSPAGLLLSLQGHLFFFFLY